MPGSTSLLAPISDTDAHFRAWGGAVSAALAAGALVQTADTGQIDWTTVVKPTTANTPSGYEIWRFDDALQATSPVFLKMEYGAGGSADSPSFWFTLGSGSDGAGTLTGATSTRTQLAGGASSSTAWSCYFCGGTNRFVMALFVAGTSPNNAYSMFWGLERTVDATGAPTGEGVQLIWKGYPSWSQVAWNCTSGLMSTIETSLGCMGPSVGSGTSGSQTAVYPIYLTKGVFLYPGLNLLACYEANFSPGTPAAFPYYGATRQYMPVLNTVTGNVLQRGPTGSAMLVRYDA